MKPAFEGTFSTDIRQRDAQLLQIVDGAFADSARRSGEHLVCRPGCTQCCHGAFAINPLDALRLGSAMAELAKTDPDRAGAIRERARRYLTEFGPEFPGDRVTGILGESEEERAAFDDFANEAACPVLDPATGLCDLYDARPMTCRVFGPPVRMESAEAGDEEAAGFAVCELCFTQATDQEITAAEMAVPHAEEELVLAAVHDAGPSGNTVIAYCLLEPSGQPPSS